MSYRIFFITGLKDPRSLRPPSYDWNFLQEVGILRNTIFHGIVVLYHYCKFYNVLNTTFADSLYMPQTFRTIGHQEKTEICIMWTSASGLFTKFFFIQIDHHSSSLW